MSGTPLLGQFHIADSHVCPCRVREGGTQLTYGQCCGLLHRGEKVAGTAEELMRARYSAYVVHEADYLWRTWHPRRRPAFITFDDDVQWRGLDIVDTVDGQEDHRTGIVEFRAHFRDSHGRGCMVERSNFETRAKRWIYIDGDVSYEN